MELKELGTEVGITWCSECQYKRRCTECVHNKQSIEHWQKQAVENFVEKLMKACAEHKDYKIDLVALNNIVELIKK